MWCFAKISKCSIRRHSGQRNRQLAVPFNWTSLIDWRLIFSSKDAVRSGEVLYFAQISGSALKNHKKLLKNGDLPRFERGASRNCT